MEAGSQSADLHKMSTSIVLVVGKNLLVMLFYNVALVICICVFYHLNFFHNMIRCYKIFLIFKTIITLAVELKDFIIQSYPIYIERIT